MKTRGENIILYIKRAFLFTGIFMLIIYLIFNLFLEVGTDHSRKIFIIYSLAFGLIQAYHYRDDRIEKRVRDLDSFKAELEEYSWKIVQDDGDSLIIKPYFDLPFRHLKDNLIEVIYRDNIITLTGPKIYLDKLLKELNSGGPNIWARRLSSLGLIVLLVISIAIPQLNRSPLYWTVKGKYNDFRNRNVEVIQLEDSSGNSVANINNHSFAAENQDHIFYIDDYFTLVKAEKDFSRKASLIDESNGSSLHDLNVLDDYIFFTSGSELYRMNLNDMSQSDILYKSSYIVDVHIVDNQIYFINFMDDFRVYTMDVNGRNFRSFFDLRAEDIAIYDGRMYFSYAENELAFTESIGLDGKDRRIEFEEYASDLVIEDGYFYYLGENDKLYRNKIARPSQPQLLVDEEIYFYTIHDDRIYYTPNSNVRDYVGQGLYRASLDGSDKTEIDDRSVHGGGLNIVNGYLLFRSKNEHLSHRLVRLNLKTGTILEI